MNIKCFILISYNYAGFGLVFSKTIYLTFAPFYGLNLIINEEQEVKLKNTDYCSTEISFNLKKDQFEVIVRNFWKDPVSDETIDSKISMFSNWERHDNTNIKDLKELMQRINKEVNKNKVIISHY